MAHHSSPQFPPHSFRPGDIVQIEEHATDSSQSKGKGKSVQHGGNGQIEIPGVVFRVSDIKMTVAISSKKGRPGSSTSTTNESGLPDLPSRIQVVKVANEATFDRMEWALTKLAKALHVPLKTAHKNIDYSSSDNEDDAQNLDGLVNGSSALLSSLLGRTQPTWTKKDEYPQPTFYNTALNTSQKEAVKFSLTAQYFALIHGPPGTGKTTAVAEMVLQMALVQQKKILVCGASNLAADNLLERIIAKGGDELKKRRLGITRLGHPARVLPSLLAATLDHQAQQSSEGGLLKDVRKELESALSSLRPREAAGNKSTSSRGQASAKTQRVRGSERKERREEIKALRKEYKKRERSLLRTVLQRAGIVVATCHGAGARQLDGIDFDAIVIDEACQATEAASWIPILKAKQGGILILAGDHLQLPPTVKGYRHSHAKGKSKASRGGQKTKIPASSPALATNSDDCKEDSGHDSDDRDWNESVKYNALPRKVKRTVLRPPRSLETTLFSRLLGMYGPNCKALLDTQYRMSQEIMEFPNSALYEGKIRADESCARNRLNDVEGYEADQSQDDGSISAPLVFYDTAGCEMYETRASGAQGEESIRLDQLDSRANVHEVEIVAEHVLKLVRHGLNPTHISVLSPYSLQVSALSDRLRSKEASILEGIVIGSIDSMQGMENEVVVLSLVRSNEEHTVGFLAEQRRLNVAMTRAKRQLCVVGDSETISSAGDEYLRKWMTYLEEHACIELVTP